MKYRALAYGELLGRYWSVFRYFWKQRDALDGRFFREDEAAFLPAALALQEQPVSSTAKWTGRLLILFVLVALIWSVVGHIDIIVNAGGKVIPSSRTKTIGSIDVASVRALHVQEGQSVKAGDVLIELDTAALDAEHDKATIDASNARLQVARAEAMVAAMAQGRAPVLAKVSDVPQEAWRAEQAHLLGQYQDFKSKLDRIDGDIVRYRTALPLAAQRARDFKDLAQAHDVSTHAYLEKEQARVDLQGQLTDASNQRSALIAQTRKEAYDALAEGKRIAGDSQSDALRVASHSKLLRLTAPVDGTVQQLTVHTVGGVVPAAQPLMQIVPIQKAVEVEAFLENKDIGFVQEGQPAEVKIDAFEYTKYGTVSGHVSHVSRDAIQDEKRGLIYSAIVTLERPTIAVEGKPMALSAGMSVNVEIKTGTRRVIDYILSPLIQHQREALHER